MIPVNFSAYLKEISKSLGAGDSTEHTHRPALKTFIESLAPKIMATNEPSHTKVGAPDFNVRRNKLLIGHIECKDVDIDLRAALKTPQLKRYLANLPNLILTDYINFIWFREGKQIDKAHIARRDSKGKWQLDTEELPRLERLLINFLKVDPPEIGDPRKLAEEMARPTRMIRDTIREIFKKEEKEGPLHGQLAAFREVLLPDLSPHDFADMYAQTIAYGLFAAKTEEVGIDPRQFTWEQAFHHLPKSNPFLQSIFSKMMSPDNREPRIIPWVEELTTLLARSNMQTILEDFGKKTKQEDPVVHFYETFLKAYDAKIKKSRGVYYTPQPVVSYIVRSIDYLLKEKFGKPKGLADESVYILDPACGTGSFLLEVVKHIQENIPQAGWPDYVRRYLLPRLFGFELLVAPYTIAHLKLGLYLKGTGFEFGAEERLGVFLTNTLEPEVHGQLGFARIIAEEGKHAQKVKSKEPIMVVLGNPPYKGHSANKGKWIIDLLKGEELTAGNKTGSYFQVDGKPLKEVQLRWLHDDYVKFLRFAQWRIEKTGHGIVGMITNHGYLDNPTFRGMRQQLMQSFSEIHILDLHGNPNKKEVCPDGSKDDNVFDIKDAGVAIGIFVKTPSPSGRGTQGEGDKGKEFSPPQPSPKRRGRKSKEEENLSLSRRERVGVRVSHSQLWGLRKAKYAHLAESDIENIEKAELTPSPPFYLFIPQDTRLLPEYNKGWKITEVMPVNSVGIVTARDKLTIKSSPEEVEETVKNFYKLPVEKAREKYNLGKDARDWKVDLAQKDIKANILKENADKDKLKEEDKYDETKIKDRIVRVLYRPFDVRYTYYTGKSRGFIGQPQQRVMSHMLAGKNLGLISARSNKSQTMDHFFVSRYIMETKCGESTTQSQLFPLYLYPKPKEAGQQDLRVEEAKTRKPNLAPEFIAELEAKLGVTFIPSPPAPLPMGEEGRMEKQRSHSPLPSGEEGRTEKQRSQSPLASGEEGRTEKQRSQFSSPFGRGVRGEGVGGEEVRGEGKETQKKPLPEELLKRCRELRKSQTPAEAKLWTCLRNRQLFGAKFRRQHPVGKFILDFYCHEAKLGVELDGGGHAEEKQAEYDEERTKCLEAEGIKVLRFWNSDVEKNLAGVLEAIAAAIPLPPGEGLRVREKDSTLSPSPLTPLPKGEGGYITPEDVFHYIYAVLHSPTYRSRYAEFLKIDFPRVPLTSSLTLFRKLAAKGKELVSLHLMESAKLQNPTALSKIDLKGPIDNKNEVKTPRYDEKHKRVYINKGQYFSGVEPQVWNFHVGGYQVCYKWLKDRKGRHLNYDDITHYQRIVLALRETIRLMASIDKTIPS